MKKGFTLVELLAVIVILAVILVIAIPQVLKAVHNSRTNAYIKNEQMVANVAKTYLASNSGKAPVSEGYITIVSLNELQENNLIGDIKDVSDKQTKCTGYVLIINLGNDAYDYQSYLNCGENYETEGYPTESLQEVDVLVVAGGGAGGSHKATAGTSTGAGGGGAGGLIFRENYYLNTNFYQVTVGKGGISPENSGSGGQGENSQFDTLVAIGGGGGGFRYGEPTSGGSGGGVGYFSSTGASGISGQGNVGGSSGTNIFGGAGGGGYLEAGYYSNSHAGVNGGTGIYLGNVFGDKVGYNGYFASGGGGGSATGHPVGIGGPGAGNGGSGNNGTSALKNTGSGGGGSGNSFHIGGDGGSGVVLIRYFGNPKAEGGIVTMFNGYTIHVFTEVGESTFEVLEL